MTTKAFTLIELLVVIGIIAVLMSILVPSLRLARDHARASVCVSNLRTLSLAWLVYVDDNDGELVGGHVGSTPWDWVQTPSGVGDPLEDRKDAIRRGALFRYVNEVDVYHCPADARKRDPKHIAFRTYSIGGGMNGEECTGTEPVSKYIEIRSPATKYVFVEECDPRKLNLGSWLLNPTDLSKWVDPFGIWHNKRSCLGWADGRAEKHQWLDNSTIEMSELALAGSMSAFNYPVPADEGQDIAFMARGYVSRR